MSSVIIYILNLLLSLSFRSLSSPRSVEWFCAWFVNISPGRPDSGSRSGIVIVLRYDILDMSSLSESPELRGLGLSLPANMQEGGE